MLATTELIPESAGITRHNRRRVNTVQGFITAGILPAEVLGEFQQLLEKNQFRLPPGYKARYGGEAAERDSAVGNLMASVGMLMVLMISTLVLSFNSFRLAGLILVVAVLSIGPGLGSLWIAGYPFGFMAIIGTMGLVGVAINDSIVVLAALRTDEQARNGSLEAIHHIVMDESRHVLATTITTIAGFLPLLIGRGFWPPLAIAISGGVAAATIMVSLSGSLLICCSPAFHPNGFVISDNQSKAGNSFVVKSPSSGRCGHEYSLILSLIDSA
ncbi:MAG: efflux RND transporter permease subunit [Planctomycetaceae bacterium]